MTKFMLDFQTEVDILTQKELDESLSRANDAAAQAFVRGIGWRPMPQLRGTASGGVLTLGVQDDTIGPPSGYAWSIMRLAVSGLTGGATPDTVQFFRNGPASQALWQVTGAMPFASFGRLALVMPPDTTLVVGSVGTFAATGMITVSGELIQVPAEMLAKLA